MRVVTYLAAKSNRSTTIIALKYPFISGGMVSQAFINNPTIIVKPHVEERQVRNLKKKIKIS